MSQRLKSDETLEILLYRPGVDEPPTPLEDIRDLIVQPRQPWFGPAERAYVERGLFGQITDVNVDRYFVGRIGDELAGAVWYQVSRRSSDIGAFGYVWTQPEQRGKGVAFALTTAAVEHFRASGGVALYLGTHTPSAHHVYAKAGFHDYNGIAMRYLAPPHQPAGFDETLFADHGPASVRPIGWGDAGLIDALYSAPNPWLVRDYGLRSFSHPSVRQVRCHVFPAIMARVGGDDGLGLVLENPLGRIVGATLLTRGDPRVEPHLGSADFVVMPAYTGQATDLLESLTRAAAGRGVTLVQLQLAATDTAKRDIARAAAFRRDAVLPGRLHIGDERVALELWSLGG